MARCEVCGNDRDRRNPMPLYEYRCKDCGKEFQVIESLPEHEKHRKVRCPGCSSGQTERVWSPVFVETAKKS